MRRRRAHLYRPEAAGAGARAGARAASCCCSTSGSPASTRPSWTTASRSIRSLRRRRPHHRLVEHVMDAIRSLCDRCIVMNAGRKIADGAPHAVLADPEVVRAYLGDDRCLRCRHLSVALRQAPGARRRRLRVARRRDRDHARRQRRRQIDAAEGDRRAVVPHLPGALIMLDGRRLDGTAAARDRRGRRRAGAGGTRHLCRTDACART